MMVGPGDWPRHGHTGRRPLIKIKPKSVHGQRKKETAVHYQSSKARGILMPVRRLLGDAVGLHCNACAVSWTDNASVHGDLERAEPLGGRHVRRSAYLCIREHSRQRAIMALGRRRRYENAEARG